PADADTLSLHDALPILLADDDAREQPQHRVPRPGVERDDAVARRVPQHRRQGFRMRRRGSGLHELDAEHGALAAHLADDTEALGPVSDPGGESALHAPGLTDEVVAFDDLEDLERRGRRHRVAAEGAADAARLHGIHDLGTTR